MKIVKHFLVKYLLCLTFLLNALNCNTTTIRIVRRVTTTIQPLSTLATDENGSSTELLCPEKLPAFPNGYWVDTTAPSKLVRSDPSIAANRSIGAKLELRCNDCYEVSSTLSDPFLYCEFSSFVVNATKPRTRKQPFWTLKDEELSCVESSEDCDTSPTTTTSKPLVQSCTVPVILNGFLTEQSLSTGNDTLIFIGPGGKINREQSLFLHCNRGFSTSSDETYKIATCGPAGRWIPPIGPQSCNKTVILCPETGLQKIANGIYLTNGSNTVNSELFIRCNTGYRISESFKGVASIHCQSNGQWSSMPEGLACNPVVCGKLPSFSNGAIGNGSSTYRVRRNVTCNKGYKLENGSATSITCQQNGQWTEVGRCLATFCLTSNLPELTNATFYGDNNSQRFSSGTVLRIKCDLGFKMSDNSDTTISCANGQWSTISVECQEITCPISALPAFKNGILQQTSDNEFPFGSILIVNCTRGYILAGNSSSTTCLEDGTWSALNASCFRPSTTTKPSLSEKEILNAQLFRAIRAGSFESVKKLVSIGANISATDWFYGRNSLLLSIYQGDYNIASYLLEKGASAESKDKFGDTALILAAGRNYPELVAKLFEYGPDMNRRNNNGYSALMRAAYWGYIDVVKILIANGADVNLKKEGLSCSEFCGLTALSIAVRENNVGVVQLLKEAGASPEGCLLPTICNKQ